MRRVVTLVTVVTASVLAFACGSSSPAGPAPGSDGGAPGDASIADTGRPDQSAPDTGATADSAGVPDGPLPDSGAGCGYQGRGTKLHVAAGLDLCMPSVVCTSETCPPPLGNCVAGACVFDTGYQGVATLPEAWATHYCALSTGGCHGVTQIDFPEVTAASIAQALGHPLCDGGNPSGAAPCIGIAASSPMVVGNSQVATDPSTGKTVTNWGLGLTEASGLCYAISGPGGNAIVALTDRCGGYCKCNGSGYEECGPCVSAPSMVPNCPCVGTAPGVASQCCGLNCGGTVVAECDWCASNNHPHFDLDDATFNWVCGAQASNGSCKLTQAGFVPCLTAKPWPPGGGGGSCGANAFNCAGTPAAHQDGVPGTSCCCNYNDCPQADGSCAAPPAACKAGSCTCGAGMPDATHPQVPATGCCCVYGTTPQADGTCS